MINQNLLYKLWLRLTDTRIRRQVNGIKNKLITPLGQILSVSKGFLSIGQEMRRDSPALLERLKLP